jgi:hypothetical protein
VEGCGKRAKFGSREEPRCPHFLEVNKAWWKIWFECQQRDGSALRKQSGLRAFAWNEDNLVWFAGLSPCRVNIPHSSQNRA